MFALRDIDMKKNFISPKSIYIDLIFLKKIIAIGYRLVLSQTAKKISKTIQTNNFESPFQSY